MTTSSQLGGKADGLLALRRAGEQVPEFVVIPPDWTAEQIAGASSQLSEGDSFAVRSSAPDEDGVSAMAGHYLTELEVSRDRLPQAVIRVRHCAAEPIAVIIQTMVPATVSGVAFSADPTGILDLVVISAGAGIGAVVANDRPTLTCARSRVDGRGWTTAEPGAPTVPEELLARIEQAAVRIEADRGQPIDLEWAWQADSDQLWIVQARPITTLALEADQVCLDNSNIVENYPGLVLPMTASFVPETYRAVFTALAERLCPHAALLELYRPIVAAMVQAHSGRMYYRLEHWYRVMALMPFSHHYIRIWQRSLGVTEGGRPLRLPAVSRLTRLRVATRLVRELIRTPRELAGLSARVEQAATTTRARLTSVEHPAELRPLYQQLIDELVCHWDLTLLNDVRAFVFGALTTRIDPVAGGAAVSGHTTVESLRPLAELARLAERTRAEGHDLSALIDHRDSAELASAWLAVDDPLRRDIASYVDRYGDRWLEELKLESPTLRTDPTLLITALSSALRVQLPEPAPVPRNWLARWLAAAAGEAVGLRESSRLDRSRVHALVRDLALKGGELLAAMSWIDHPSEVFWLTLEELFSADGDQRQLIAGRRADHQSWSRLPAFRRLTFAGEPVDLHLPGSTELRPTAAGGSAPGTLVGQGVSRGIGRGRVRLVDDPRDLDEVDGAVLVTAATDPGWVFLLPRCAAVVAERGSMLSHTSIVARELGVPVVVAAADATTRLCEGDLVEVDGQRGTITVLEGN